MLAASDYTEDLVFMSFKMSSSGYTNRWPICLILYLSIKDYKVTKHAASYEMGGMAGRP